MDYILEGLRPLAIEVASLTLDPANARLHNDRNIDSIRASLVRFGQRKPVVVQRQGMIVRAGNGTVLAAKRLGWEMIAAVVVDETDVTATAFAIADNRTAELATWDEKSLAELLQSLPDELSSDVGFSADEIDKLIAEVSGELPDTEVQIPEPPDDPITKPGDIWSLGQHRLLCGASEDPECIKAVLAGEVVHLVNADPPYNVNADSRSETGIAAGSADWFKRGKHPQEKMEAKHRPLINDALSPQEYDAIVRKWFANFASVLEPGRGFYIWGGYHNCARYATVLKEVGLYFSQAIIWVKEHPVLTRKDFMGNHEWCYYGWKEGAAHWFNPSVKNATDVWTVKKVSNAQMIHLTEKPVELALRAIQYSSKEGECVLDPFGGSGSTLIAAELMSRRAFLIEIDPLYCDVIVQRWQHYTRNTAMLVTA